MKTFYNTIRLGKKQLNKAVAQCNCQEERILFIYETFGANQGLTPFEAQNIYHRFWSDTPITSIRRAITNLELKSKLTKTDVMRQGKYDKPNHVWRIK